MKEVNIANIRIGEGEPCFIIAEAGVNHNGDVNLAKKLIDVAKEAGADAVKFQTFKAEELATSSAEKAGYQKETTPSEESQYDMIIGNRFPKREKGTITKFNMLGNRFFSKLISILV